MNQTFNLTRFSRLFVKHTADHYKTYLMSFFVLLGVLFLSLGFVAYMGGKLPLGAQIPFFIFALLIGGSIFTSFAFSDLGDKKKAISALTLPASHFEKYLVGWTYTFVIFQLLFIPAFYLVIIIINQLTPSEPGEIDSPLLDLFSRDQGVYIAFLLYSIVHAVAMWGSIFFEKYHFIKTAFAFFIGILFLSLLNTELMKRLLNIRSVTSAVPFGQVNLRDENDHYFRVLLSEQDSIRYIAIAFILVTIILWACTFYRLKEKEV